MPASDAVSYDMIDQVLPSRGEPTDASRAAPVPRRVSCFQIIPGPRAAGHAPAAGPSWRAPGCHRPAQMVESARGAVPGTARGPDSQAACRTRCACEPGAPTRSYAELRLSSRPCARYQSRTGVPRSVARRFAATSTIATTIAPARVRLSTAARAAAASVTSMITCCRRLASRASCRVPLDMGAGSANPVLIVISSRSPRNHLRGAPRNFGRRRTPRFRSFVRTSPVAGFSPLPVPAPARFAGSRSGRWDVLAVDVPYLAIALCPDRCLADDLAEFRRAVGAVSAGGRRLPGRRWRARPKKIRR